MDENLLVVHFMACHVDHNLVGYYQQVTGNFDWLFILLMVFKYSSNKNMTQSLRANGYNSIVSSAEYQM